jgi:ATP-binding cassette subfamily C protein
MDILKTFFDLLTPRERRNLYLLFCAVLVMAGLEVVSVGSIMPFLQVAADPASVHENAYLSWAYETVGFADTNAFLIALGLAALVALLISNAFIVFTTWALHHYVWGRNHSLSLRLLQNYLDQPYEYFLTENSAELGKNILEEMRQLTTGMLKPALQGLSKAIVGVAIVGFLVFVNPVVALVIATILGCAYAGIYYVVHDRVDTFGRERVEANTERYKLVNEAFGGVKEVKLRGKETSFIKQFVGPSKRYTHNQARYKVFQKVPKYILEGIAFGGIILIAVYLIAARENIRKVIPMLGLYAFAGYRLMPALQRAYKGLASARFNLAALDEVHEDLQESAEKTSRIHRNGAADSTPDPLPLERRLRLEDVHYKYPGAEKWAIKNFSFNVPAHTTVGFVGKTGSGKTTTVDLVLGLLRPQRGRIIVDETLIRDHNLRRWQQNIGYVPQQIYLSDDTVARNIAFGVPRDEIDMDIVRDVARRAHIYDFVANELPERWETFVGERGVKLSGGQRQRIGIARALYHNPSVLVFDEATSALDQSTEKNVMNAIYDLKGDHTMLMIAHRLSTVQRADNIVMLERGCKVGEGTYNSLKRQHSKFQSMTL